MYNPDKELAKLDDKTVGKFAEFLQSRTGSAYSILARAIRFQESVNHVRNYVTVFGVTFPAYRLADVLGMNRSTIIDRLNRGLQDGDLIRRTKKQPAPFIEPPGAGLGGWESGRDEALRLLTKHHRDRAISVLKYGRHLDDLESDAGETGRASYDTLRCRNASFEGVRSTGLMEAS